MPASNCRVVSYVALVAISITQNQQLTALVGQAFGLSTAFFRSLLV